VTEISSFASSSDSNPSGSAVDPAEVNSQNDVSTEHGLRVNLDRESVNLPQPQRLFDAALEMQHAGINVVPVKEDGTKAPDLPRWTKYQKQHTTGDQIWSWFGSDQKTGIGCIYGEISGNVEMLEFEGRAVDEGILDEVTDLMENCGFASAWEAITTGWVDRSPSGGIHFRFRVEGAPVKGNTKLASRPSTDEELAAWKAEQQRSVDAERNPEVRTRRQNKLNKITSGDQVPQVLIETRGEGGFGVVAPSHGKVHETGKPWVRLHGGPDTIPVIDAETYEAIWDICRASDRMPKPEAPQWKGRPPKDLPPGHLRPGDDYNERGDVGELLQAHGWTFVYQRGPTSYWRRPGKSKGISASLNYRGSNRFYVFTSSTEFDNERAYTPFSTYAILEHNGNYKEAAKALGQQGYGTSVSELPPIPGQRDPGAYDPWATEKTDASGQVVTREQQPAPVPPAPPVPSDSEEDAGETEFETLEEFAERLTRINDVNVRKNEARKRVKQLAAKGSSEEERQVERDYLKQACKLSAGDFKALYASAARASAPLPDGSDGRPVYVMGDELREYSNLVELIENGVFPETYVRDGKLVHVGRVSGVRTTGRQFNTATYQSKDITPAALRRLVATYTMPYRQTEKGADSPLPSRAVCESVLDNSEWDGVDTLNGLTDAPFVRADGTICQAHGFDTHTGMWLALPPGYQPVPENPTPEDVAGAMDLLMGQVLRDFPFASTADRANTVGMLLTPMIRNITRCAVPLHVISAHTPGTGKTLLAKIAIAVHGGSPYQFARNSDEELRKTITSILMDQAAPVVNFDNLATGSTIESPVLASLITSDVWRDRVLGGNSTISLPNDKLWLATGNNLKVNTDFSQRTLMIQLDAGTERPDLRPTEEFALKDLEEWLLDDSNRALLTRALLILIRDWAAAGMPRSDHTMRSFTPWAQAIGGLLAHHGISDFNANQDVVAEADEEKQQDALFLQKWTELLPDRWISASDLITRFQVMEQQRWVSGDGMAIDKWQGSFPLRSNGKPYSAIGLGKWLGARKDTPTHGFVLRRRVDPDTNRSMWRVERNEPGQKDVHEQQGFFEPHRT
jgi:hypothetical protein